MSDNACTELLNPTELGQSKYGDNSAFLEIASGSSYLPRLMLMNATSELVKEGKINQGHYALVTSKERVEDMTKEVSILVLGWRPKALVIGEKDVKSFYNPKSAEFIATSKRADTEINSGCLYGPEFLIYVPMTGQFATFFMSSKTARREAPQLRPLIGKAATLKSTLIKGKKNSWFGPIVTTCSAPLNGYDQEEAKAQLRTFNNPPELAEEKAENVEVAADDDRPR